MQQRALGPFKVSAIGLGCMNLSHAYVPLPPRAQAEALLLHALERGVTLFDTAALYGLGLNEELLGQVLSPHRTRFTLATKGGMHANAEGQRVVDGRPSAIKWSCEQSLRRLRTEVIDLYYLHRWDQRVPIEDSVGAVADLVSEGKVRAIGLSEVSAATLRRAHAVHPIAAVQSEYSLWTRNPEIAVLDACRDIGATLVAFSPLGRGFLSGALRDVSVLSENDLRRTMPRFTAPHHASNLRLLDGLVRIAAELGCSLSQLALAWVLARGRHVVPIPGTRHIDHLDDDLGAVNVGLDNDVMQRLDQLINPRTVSGARYDDAAQSQVDTEEF